jgi:hypothetical protein
MAKSSTINGDVLVVVVLLPHPDVGFRRKWKESKFSDSVSESVLPSGYATT